MLTNTEEGAPPVTCKPHVLLDHHGIPSRFHCLDYTTNAVTGFAMLDPCMVHSVVQLPADARNSQHQLT